MRSERLQLKNGFGEFQVQTGLRRGADPTFLGYTARGSMRLKACSSLGRKHALWGQESQVPAGKDLGLLSQQGLKSGPHGPGCVPEVRSFQPITDLGWSLSGSASPHGEVSVTSVGL